VAQIEALLLNDEPDLKVLSTRETHPTRIIAHDRLCLHEVLDQPAVAATTKRSLAFIVAGNYRLKY